MTKGACNTVARILAPSSCRSFCAKTNFLSCLKCGSATANSRMWLAVQPQDANLSLQHVRPTPSISYLFTWPGDARHRIHTLARVANSMASSEWRPVTTEDVDEIVSKISLLTFTSVVPATLCMFGTFAKDDCCKNARTMIETTRNPNWNMT